jgi:hypothetical protein
VKLGHEVIAQSAELRVLMLLYKSAYDERYAQIGGIKPMSLRNTVKKSLVSDAVESKCIAILYVYNIMLC